MNKKTSALLFSLILLPAVAFAQAPAPAPLPIRTELNTREFLSRQGDGNFVPTARITFRQEEEGRLCAVLGIKRGPKALNKTFFSFTRLTTMAGDTDNQNVKFSFPKKPNAKEKALHIYEHCVESSGRSEDVEKDLLRVLVRRPGKKPTNFFIDYPPTGDPWVMNIMSDSNGMLTSQSVREEGAAAS